ncbi:unnamed protein product [Aureobasidium vineae]|uniref:MYND-type domain-containing protein n=1 Tax=Aureobasidium vineae TaxID=2773715 RepID=A0A9N8P8B0_9PEZI|nr:unnamed protein product [Aureobasidium vineae]
MSASQPQDQPEASSSSSAQSISELLLITHRITTTGGKTCAQCKKLEEDPEDKPLKACTTCKSVYYCSRECTKAHYKVHKKECAKLAQEYSKTAVFKPAVRSSAPKEGHKGGLQKWQFDT